jgi:glutamyl-tRNA synthetase/glutamyl-Q tRNA(Asp) synthetase
VVNAIYVWGIARARGLGSGGGTVLLRIEDHDRIRCRPEYEAAILQDLDWLGFVPDAGRHPVLRQSDEPGAYESALDDLPRRHHVYACRCSRREIGGRPYDGRCRELGLPWDVRRPEGLQLPAYGLRVQMPEGEDILIRDRDGQWTYQFSVVVDDLRQDITHVIRGEDLADSTQRQVILRAMIHSPLPTPHPQHDLVFIHHPLLLKPSGEKLSKSAGDTGVRELRAAGLSPEEVIGRAAAGVRLIDTPAHAIHAREVARMFA